MIPQNERLKDLNVIVGRQVETIRADVLQMFFNSISTDGTVEGRQSEIQIPQSTD